MDQVLISFQPLNIVFDDFKNLTNSTSSRGKISSFLEKMFNLGNRERDRKGEGEGGESEGERKRGIKCGT